MDNVTITRQDDPLIKEVWMFHNLGNSTITLVWYAKYGRETVRHRTWRHIAKYDRNDKRNTTITRSDLPLPQDVIDEALETYRQQIKFSPNF